MTLSELFESYLKAGLYLKGWSDKTPVIYRRAFTSFQQSQGEQDNCTALPSVNDEGDVSVSKAQLETWIVTRRQAGVSAAGINIYIRAMNAFCSWLKEEGHVATAVKLKQVRIPSKQLVVFSEDDVRRILAFKPSHFTDWRIFTLVALLIDTSVRIDEALTLPLQNIDFDNLLIKVRGKGNKERIVPFSFGLRKHLYRFSQMRKIKTATFFYTRSGLPLRYRNTYRDIKRLCAAVDVEGDFVRPHCFRHFFAVHYINAGGSLVHLSRILGHSSISTTQIYLRSMGVQEMAERHSQYSAVS
jgi:integrase/recombinase XerD